MGEKAKKILGIVILVGLLLFVLLSGVYDLVNTKDRHTVEILYGGELLEVEHSINGIIPMGKDYYYIGIDSSMQKAYVIHAPKKWDEKNLFIDGVREAPLQVTGLVKRISGYEIRDEVYARLSEAEGLQFPYGADRSLELTYITDSCMKIGSALLLLALMFVAYRIPLGEMKESPVWGKVYLVLMMVGLVVMLIAIM